MNIRNFFKVFMSEKKVDENDENSTNILLDEKVAPKKPSLYQVLILNDDYTPMEFVVHVLEKIFNKQQEEATQIMLHVHRNGVGVCGTYTFEVAESKCKNVIDFAKNNEHPLQCTMERS